MLDITYKVDISPWAKRVGKIPTLARYQTLTGLKPLGRHITLAESLLKDITRRVRPATAQVCTAPTGPWAGWPAPPAMELGDAYCITPHELQALRLQVLDRDPDAAALTGSPAIQFVVLFWR